MAVFTCMYCGQVLEMKKSIGLALDDCGCQDVINYPFGNPINERMYKISLPGITRVLDEISGRFINRQQNPEQYIGRLRIINKYFLLMFLKVHFSNISGLAIEVPHMDELIDFDLDLYASSMDALRVKVFTQIAKHIYTYPEHPFYMDIVISRDVLFIYFLNRH